MSNIRLLLKKLVPKRTKRLILILHALSLRYTLHFFTLRPFLSSVYYCFFSRKFDREHLSVLSGRLAYLKKNGQQTTSNTLLRRNIHRIEKGLIMEPRKCVFALDYIDETVNAFYEASRNPYHSEREIKWASDVLCEYFDVIEREHLSLKTVLLLEQVKCRVNKIARHNADAHIPYTFSKRKLANISYEQLKMLFEQRRSVRWFENKPVPKSVIEKAVDLATLAPSACNRQPYHFLVIDDGQLLDELMALPIGTKGFAHNVPCSIVVTADLSYFPTEKDRHLIYIDSALATMQLMLAFETLGLSSCPINWPDIEEREEKISSLLDLDTTVRPILLLAVGYGSETGKIPYSQKKGASQLVSYINNES